MRRCLLLECYKMNAFLILLTLILHDRFCMVFGITVNPLDSIIAFDADDYDDTKDNFNGFASEVHDLNNIDYKQFTNGYKYYGSHELVSEHSIKPHHFCSNKEETSHSHFDDVNAIHLKDI